MPRKSSMAFQRAVGWFQFGSSTSSQVRIVHELEDVSSMPDNIRRHLIRIIGICEGIDSQLMHNLMRESQRTGSGEDSRILTIKNVEEQIKREPKSHLVSSWLDKIEAIRMAIQQSAFDQKEFPQLMNKLNTHAQKDIFSYFKDHSLVDFWNHRFSLISSSFGKALRKLSGESDEGEIAHLFCLYLATYNDLAGVCAEVGLLLEDASQCLPLEVEAGINARLRSLQSLIQSMQITAQKVYKEGAEVNHLPSSEMLYQSPRLGGGAYQTKLQNGKAANLSSSALKISYPWISAALEPPSILVLFLLTIVAGTALQVTAFANPSQAMAPGSAFSADFLSVCQQFVWQTFGLYLTIVPALGTDHFSRCFGFWTWLFTGVSLFAGVASLILYTTASPAACAMAGFAANAAQAFVVLQLVQGIGKIPKTKAAVS